MLIKRLRFSAVTVCAVMVCTVLTGCGSPQESDVAHNSGSQAPVVERANEPAPAVEPVHQPSTPAKDASIKDAPTNAVLTAPPVQTGNKGVPERDNATASSEQRYSIQVRAVPLDEKAEGMASYRALRDKGYLVYTYRAQISGQPWLRVVVGVFESSAAAARFGESFSTKEALDYYVTAAPVRVVAATGGEFVLTPSALWTRVDGKVHEVLVFSDPAPRGFKAPDEITLKPSPDAKAVAFQYGERVYAAHLADEQAKLLSGDKRFYDEPVYGPDPHWSPSGQYVAFHDFLEFEHNTSLWLARADGSELRKLVNYEQYAVKDFIWQTDDEPSSERILFVKRYSMGTVSVGGSIQSVDMQGKITTVLENDQQARQQLAGPLSIKDGFLHYRIAQFEENWVSPTFSEERVPLSDL